MYERSINSTLVDGNYIINMQSSTDEGNGTHWVCFIKRTDTIYYMDSFGMPPPQDLVDLGHKYSDKIFYNNKQIQNMKSILCVLQHCIM